MSRLQTQSFLAHHLLLDLDLANLQLLAAMVPPSCELFSRTLILSKFGIWHSQVSVIIGELIGRYTNDWIMNLNIRRNKGVFEAESRLW